ncbi:MAG: 2,3,4,5-tetrahydropyridine-2,6-dicarboxylate N-succinyltransferase [Alphaproteobacteria bacterium]|nr:2,3,4,5-tetrahydropyridine-2,6-dicarboxylate N-succinyltransferase [Alphaproteobacteria bacterium]
MINNIEEIKNNINYWYDNNVVPDLNLVDTVLNFIKSGAIRPVQFSNNKYVVNTWVKKAILLAFKYYPCREQYNNSYDKLGLLEYNYNSPTYRKVPGALIRDYVYIGQNAIIMPSYINIGAYIGSNTMIDINATIGSCAQIGNNCHIAANACIGGVLEPVVAMPVVIENNCFIGANSAILEGVVVEHNSIISAGVTITSSTKIIDRETGETYKNLIPSKSVVVPGSYQSKNGLNINCAIIIKKNENINKLNINQDLRN